MMPRIFREALFLPFAPNRPRDVVGQGDPCGMSGSAAHFAALWLAVLGERAAVMSCDNRLVTVAAAHARYLDSRTPAQLEAMKDVPHAMHIGPDGSRPNQRVRQGGYALPGWHGEGNTVESCARSSPDAAHALEGLLHSPSHHDHLMGVGFFAANVVYGIGNVGRDWVILICPLEE